MNKISGVVLTNNNEKTLDKCLTSLQKVVSEIVVVDDNSTDNTEKIALKYKAKIYKRDLNNNFSDQRNYGMSKTSYDWVLFLDSDEYLTDELIAEIRNLDLNSGVKGYYLPRKATFKGLPAGRQGEILQGGEFGKTNLLRLGNKNAGKWVGSVHEYWDIVGENAYLSQNIIHNITGGLFDLLEKINNYAILHANDKNYNKVKASFYKIFVFPLLKFIDNFILKKGFLDGVTGFVLALIMSFHSFLSWGHLWLISREKKK